MLSRIELRNCSFSGPLPNSMTNLTQLRYLDLSSNGFEGSIPSFNRSRNLTHIDLSRNDLREPIPSSFVEGLLNLVYVDLRFNSLNGTIPSSLFNLPSLQKLQLSNNHFDGQLTDFLTASQLDTVDLSSNNLNGPIPLSLFDLKRLNILSLSSNNFTGIVLLEMIQRLSNLTKLDLSYNSLSINASGSNSNFFPNLTTLNLASCNLQGFPNLKNQSRLFHLDLSNNQIGGEIPNWIWEVGNGSLVYLNLSRNLLVGLQEPFVIPSLSVLDLHSNNLGGKIPIPQASVYVDYSSNDFNSSIPADIGNNLTWAYFFSVSNNNITGNQFSTFENTSFKGNMGLCGFPLTSDVEDNHSYPETEINPNWRADESNRHSDTKTQINGNLIAVECGFITGLGIVVGPLLFCKRWREWYYKYVDRIVFKILHRQEQGRKNRGRRPRRNPIRRHKG
ncbi:unnamed protein product [Ilex paraguariensis]|uniref:Uncharacterized protein n=1 Tax=Ilex paraguariensis TaxID=185542 RepID=A0ABC8UCN3_9AQUA